MTAPAPVLSEAGFAALRDEFFAPATGSERRRAILETVMRRLQARREAGRAALAAEQEESADAL